MRVGLFLTRRVIDRGHEARMVGFGEPYHRVVEGLSLAD